MPQPPVSTQPAPNWGNTHAPDCPLTQGREELWAEFTSAISSGPDGSRDMLWGCVIEYAAGGDEDAEQCDCLTHNSPEQSAAIRTATQDYYERRNSNA